MSGACLPIVGRRLIGISSPVHAITEPLFTPLMQAVLGATVLRAEREWYLSDLAGQLGVGPSSIHRTLAKLTRSGILTRRQDGNRIYYRPDPACPILGELAGILTKTVGIVEPLRDALAVFATRIRVALIHGSIAEDREHSESEIDLIIVGDVSGLELAGALQPLQDRLGREVHFTRYTVEEFASKAAHGHNFLAAVLQRRRIFLIGDEHNLDEIVGRQASRVRGDKQIVT